MRWIDFENKKPTDTDIPGWTAWSQASWSAWLAKSAEHLTALEQFHAADQTTERNKYIDDHSVHWGLLKPWLMALSHNKCWFSDSKDTYSHYHVEHFRPKKEAKNLDKTKRDGYWWLAFEYSNYRLCGNVGNSKKGGWFPLRTGSLCSTFDAQCEESETRYFLDPTDPEDVELVAFDEEGNLIPAPGCHAWEAERVEESVKRLKLNEHEMLPEARREIWKKMSQKIDLYRAAKARSAKTPNPGAEADVRRILREIKDMLNPKAHLSSVAKWCLLFRNDVQLLKLVT